ncbi:uncharacterized protein VTP21DRAFT_7843 [Calcarisporiella thermophila]|uniref:uncharacterized protein n=1 Tax=Calcarisporiella thermophila TaxID=911321 RepID=UPI0037446EC7
MAPSSSTPHRRSNDVNNIMVRRDNPSDQGNNPASGATGEPGALPPGQDDIAANRRIGNGRREGVLEKFQENNQFHRGNFINPAEMGTKMASSIIQAIFDGINGKPFENNSANQASGPKPVLPQPLENGKEKEKGLEKELAPIKEAPGKPQKGKDNEKEKQQKEEAENKQPTPVPLPSSPPPPDPNADQDKSKVNILINGAPVDNAQNPADGNKDRKKEKEREKKEKEKEKEREKEEKEREKEEKEREKEKAKGKPNADLPQAPQSPLSPPPPNPPTLPPTPTRRRRPKQLGKAPTPSNEPNNVVFTTSTVTVGPSLATASAQPNVTPEDTNPSPSAEPASIQPTLTLSDLLASADATSKLTTTESATESAPTSAPFPSTQIEPGDALVTSMPTALATSSIDPLSEGGTNVPSQTSTANEQATPTESALNTASNSDQNSTPPQSTAGNADSQLAQATPVLNSASAQAPSANNSSNTNTATATTTAANPDHGKDKPTPTIDTSKSSPSPKDHNNNKDDDANMHVDVASPTTTTFSPDVPATASPTLSCRAGVCTQEGLAETDRMMKSVSSPLEQVGKYAGIAFACLVGIALLSMLVKKARAYVRKRDSGSYDDFNTDFEAPPTKQTLQPQARDAAQFTQLYAAPQTNAPSSYIGSYHNSYQQPYISPIPNASDGSTAAYGNMAPYPTSGSGPIASGNHAHAQAAYHSQAASSAQPKTPPAANQSFQQSINALHNLDHQAMEAYRAQLKLELTLTRRRRTFSVDYGAGCRNSFFGVSESSGGVVAALPVRDTDSDGRESVCSWRRSRHNSLDLGPRPVAVLEDIRQRNAQSNPFFLLDPLRSSSVSRHSSRTGTPTEQFSLLSLGSNQRSSGGSATSPSSSLFGSAIEFSSVLDSQSSYSYRTSGSSGNSRHAPGALPNIEISIYHDSQPIEVPQHDKSPSAALPREPHTSSVDLLPLPELPSTPIDLEYRSSLLCEPPSPSSINIIYLDEGEEMDGRMPSFEL